MEQDAKVFSTFREAPPAAKAILIGMLINRLGTFLNIFLVLYMTHRGFTTVQAGVALGVYGFGGVVGVLVGTALADWLGARRATVLSMGGRAVLMVGILYLRNYPALLVDVAVVGMIGLVYRPASASLLSELTPKDRQGMIFAGYRVFPPPGHHPVTAIRRPADPGLLQPAVLGRRDHVAGVRGDCAHLAAPPGGPGRC